MLMGFLLSSIDPKGFRWICAWQHVITKFVHHGIDCHIFPCYEVDFNRLKRHPVKWFAPTDNKSLFCIHGCPWWLPSRFHPRRVIKIINLKIIQESYMIARSTAKFLPFASLLFPIVMCSFLTCQPIVPVTIFVLCFNDCQYWFTSFNPFQQPWPYITY